MLITPACPFEFIHRASCIDRSFSFLTLPLHSQVLSPIEPLIFRKHGGSFDLLLIHFLHRVRCASVGIHGDCTYSEKQKDKFAKTLASRYSIDMTIRAGPVVLVADESMLAALLTQLDAQSESDQKLLNGVLVIRNASMQYSNLDAKFPQADFALYNEEDRAWNSQGTGHLWASFPFSIQYVDHHMADLVLRQAKYNKGKVR